MEELEAEVSNFFGKLFKKAPDKRSQPEPKPAFEPRRKPIAEQAPPPGAAYKKGDFIGQFYQVNSVLGIGGFGVVYLVYSHQLRQVFALKTFRDEYLSDQEIRKRFLKEANVWVDLGHHPYLVRAKVVDEISGRLYLVMEYVPPNEQGLNSLEGYLRRSPPDLAQSLRWAIQICYSMEYAISKGVRAHRDLKPANILISQDKTAKVTDFGLAGVITGSSAHRGEGLAVLSGQTMLGEGLGTPTHMPPEQFEHAAAGDERSDIYSFGVILFQLASAGRLPFSPALSAGAPGRDAAAVWREYYRLHRQGQVPRLDTPLMPIIQRCLAKHPGDRYGSFAILRGQLEQLLQEKTGQVIPPPTIEADQGLDFAYRAYSLNRIGRYQEAFECYDKALAFNPAWSQPWRGKGAALVKMGRYPEALECFDQALKIDPLDANAWASKGGALGLMRKWAEALICEDRALEIGPPDATTLCNKANSLSSLGRYREAVISAEHALHLDPGHAAAWTEKGRAWHALGQLVEAAQCYDQALRIDPYLPVVWFNKALIAEAQGDISSALKFHQRFVELAPGAHYKQQIAHSQAKIALWLKGPH